MLCLYPHARPRPPLTSPVRKVSHNILCLALTERLLPLPLLSLPTLESLGSAAQFQPTPVSRDKVLHFIRLTLLIDLSGKLTTQRRTCTTHNVSHLAI